MPQEIQEVAYVIKRFFPHRQKVALLTRSRGRINVIIKQHEVCARLWPGMVVTCSLYREGSLWGAAQVMIHSAPVPQNHPSMVWQHHILELCYYFLPLESPCIEVFFYLKTCYSLIWQSDLFDREVQATIKKICVIKLLSMMGFYTQEEICRYLALFQELSDPFVDFTNKQKVDFLEHRLLLLRTADMDEWILNCLKSHPMFKTFKTIASNYYY